MIKILLNTSWGSFLGTFEKDIIIRLQFPGDFSQRIFFNSKNKIHLKYEKILNDFLEKRTKEINIPFKLTKITKFQKKVLITLKEKIQYGYTAYYSDLAKICDSNAFRAIGSCMAINPIPLIIPCHRIINKNKFPGNYGPGIFYKRKILQIEKEFKNEIFQ